MSKKGLSRRAVLRGLGGTVIALPFLDAMSGPRRAARAAGIGGFPKRFVVWYTPNGTVPANFWPEGGETDFQLSPILEPLAAHKSDLLILDQIDMESSHNGPGDAHQKGTGHCLTGTELQEGDFPGDAGLSAGWANGISIDQYVANQIGQSTLFPSLELGVAVQGSDIRARISFRGPGQPVPPENSPYAAYQRIFGDAAADPDALARKINQRRAVLDLVSDEYKKLQSKLGADDRLKLEAHVAAVGEIQKRLEKGIINFDGQCQPLDLGAPIDHDRVANMPNIGRLQLDLLAMAFACDLTRVGSVMWSPSTSDHVYTWVDENIREGHHSLAHKGDEDAPKVQQNTQVNAWFSEQLAYFISKLKAIPEGDGTVFDNTVIFWTNEQAKGNNHSRRRMPYLLAGSAGGYFRTGRYLSPAPGTGHNRLLVSLMNAMEVEGDTFGNPAYGTGPLPGLT
jgi:hypothetical protein